MPLGVTIPENEVRRYMGYRGPVETSPETDAMVKKAVSVSVPVITQEIGYTRNNASKV